MCKTVSALAERAANAGELDRDGLLKLVAEQQAECEKLQRMWEWLASDTSYEDLAELVDSAAYEHFKALGRTWPKYAMNFGDYARMLPLELERLRFLLAPFHGSEEDVSHAWIQTASGGSLYPLMPDPYEIKIEDIAAALSKICRFSGHLTKFYSVADHAIRVAEICEPELRFRALLHDSSEFATMDVPSPVKHAPVMWPYRRADKWLQKVIYLRFGITGDDPPELKQADRRLLATEARDLLRSHPSQWYLKYGEPLDTTIEPLTCEQAEAAFLETFYRYKPAELRI